MYTIFFASMQVRVTRFGIGHGAVASSRAIVYEHELPVYFPDNPDPDTYNPHAYQASTPLKTGDTAMAIRIRLCDDSADQFERTGPYDVIWMDNDN